ncbi:MAG: TonB-dependent receptor plug domain-containing protein [Cyclobacteriaceae bacterium]
MLLPSLLTTLKNKYKPLAILIVVLFTTGFNLPDNGLFKKTIDALEDFHAKRVQEKVYLHFDKPYYSIGDDMWFKAYLVNGQVHNNQVLSSTVYAELIDPEGNILETKTLKVMPGRGAGHFYIPDSLSAGDYMVRAYTNQMRNFDEAYFFHKELKCYGTLQEGIETKRSIAVQTITSNSYGQQKLRVDFFPEGGYLVDNLLNQVGIKVSDKYGNSVDIEGSIENENHDKIGPLKKTKFGIGSFKVIPKENRNYYASFTHNGKSHRIKLPESKAQGHILHVINNNKDNLYLHIQTNIKGGLHGAYVIGHTRGVVSFSKGNLPDAPSLKFSVKKNLLQEGIIQLTLFAANGEPLCERLAYIESEKSLYDIALNTDQENYGLRKKVTTQIQLNGINQKPLSGQFSMAVTNSDLIDQTTNTDNIGTYLLLTSDLRGKIENPKYYFDKNNEERVASLDNLLLTQGWRRFVWKQVLNDSLPQMTYYAENGFNFSGTLTNTLSNKPHPGRVSVMTKSAVNFGLKEFDTNDEGRFVLGGYQFFDTTKVFIQAKSKKVKKRKKKKGDDKLKFSDQINITLDEYSNPDVDKSLWSLAYHENIPTTLYKYLNETSRLKTTLAEYEAGTKTIVLEGIDISSTREVREEDDPFYRPGNILGRPDARLVPDSINVLSGNIFSTLLPRIAGVAVSGEFGTPVVRIRGNGAAPLFLLDNIPTEVNVLMGIPIINIAFIDVLKNPSPIYGGRGAGGVIAVFLKTGKDYARSSYAPNTLNVEHSGYYKVKEFYSPDYATPKPEHKKPDYRTTLFWEPNVNIDSTGTVQVSFYTGDIEANYNVELEGISANGDAISINKSFSITRRENN